MSEHIRLNDIEIGKYYDLIELESQLKKEIEGSRCSNSTKEMMELLHKYNDIKDATRLVLGAIAGMQGLAVADLHQEYNL